MKGRYGPKPCPGIIRVWVAGLHTLLVQAFAALLATLPGIEVVGRSEDLGDLLNRWTTNDLDLILLILSQPVDLEPLTTLHQQHPRVRVLLLSLDWSPAQAQAALQAGAIGCLAADVTAEELGISLRQVARGETTLSPGLARDLIMSLAYDQPPSKKPLHKNMTPRELEVLNLICQGMSNKQTAQCLYLSIRTIENHLIRIYNKMGVHSRTEAAVLALKQGWVETKFEN